LNYSIWGSYSEKKRTHKIEESIEFIKEKWMPIGSYKIAHPEARISDEDRQLLTDWFKSHYVGPALMFTPC
jgi:hypothetical protein